jgi:3-oxoacyl-[acyl-carrier protein] reductase
MTAESGSRLPIDRWFEGRVALVTGGTRGIGRALVRRMHQGGCKVLINHPGLAETEQEGAALLAELEQIRTGSGVLLPADLREETQVAEMFQRIQTDHGGIDYLLNNAGILRDRTLAKMTFQEWNEVIQVNLTGTFLCCRYAVELMRPGGAIVSLSSYSAQAGLFGQTNYAASKAGLIGLTRSLSREMAGRRIRVNAIAPGFVETAMTAGIPEQQYREMAAAIPLQRAGKPDEIADAAAFLCSEMASYITGQTLGVNGGIYFGG